MTIATAADHPLTESDPRRAPRNRLVTNGPVLDVVVPVHNEQAVLETTIRRLHRYLGNHLPATWRITIADNASTDATWAIACRLGHELPNIRLQRLTERGRGRALSQAWRTSDATVLAYMDVDLSTDLAALLPLVAPLLSGHSDLAIGTRLARSARVVRGPKRELISRCYNAILHTTLRTGFSDAQCGFKAIRRDRADALLPRVRDREWFFDTELLVLAERDGLRIHEVPVDWVDDPDSRVDIVPTALADLRGVARLMAGSRPVRFAAIGVVSTAAYLFLYAALRAVTGALLANALALAATAVANTSANRRLTFGITQRRGAIRHQLQGFGVFVFALVLTSSGLAALDAADPHPPRLVEVGALILAQLAATVVRYVLLSSWVFRRPPPHCQTAQITQITRSAA